MRFWAPEKRKITLILPVLSPAWIEDRGGEAVSISLAELRKGTVDCVTPRAPLDAKLYQEDEDDEAHLLDLAVGSGMVGNGGTRGMPVS
jgi:hypothetical protein